MVSSLVFMKASSRNKLLPSYCEAPVLTELTKVSTAFNVTSIKIKTRWVCWQEETQHRAEHRLLVRQKPNRAFWAQIHRLIGFLFYFRGWKCCRRPNDILTRHCVSRPKRGQCTESVYQPLHCHSCSERFLWASPVSIGDEMEQAHCWFFL